MTTLYAGAAHWASAGKAGNQGGFFRMNLGEGRWQHVEGGLPGDVEVRAIAVHPRDASVIYAGTQHGPFRSTDGGERWTKLAFPDRGMVVWSFLFHPRDPRVLYAGTAPAAIYKSTDGGDTWRRLPAL